VVVVVRGRSVVCLLIAGVDRKCGLVNQKSGGEDEKLAPSAQICRMKCKALSWKGRSPK
jgi:hypothetical protein